MLDPKPGPWRCFVGLCRGHGGGGGGVQRRRGAEHRPPAPPFKQPQQRCWVTRDGVPSRRGCLTCSVGPQKPSMDLLRKLGRIWSLPQMGCLEEAGGGELRAATVPAGWLRDQRPALAGTAASVLRKGHLEAELGVARGPGRWKAVEEGGRRGLLPGDGPRNTRGTRLERKQRQRRSRPPAQGTGARSRADQPSVCRFFPWPRWPAADQRRVSPASRVPGPRPPAPSS